jgi:hypothetical protein
MARIRFLGDSETCTWLGVTFVKGEWVEQHNLSTDEIARVAAHPHFEAEGSPAKSKTKV